MKIDTKEKINLFIALISPYYSPSLGLFPEKSVRGYYLFEKLLSLALDLGSPKITFSVDFSAEAKKNNKDSKNYKIWVDEVKTMSLVGAGQEANDIFNYLVNEKEVLKYLNMDRDVVKLICHGSNCPMTTTLTLTKANIDTHYLSRLKNFNDDFMLFFQKEYNQIIDNENKLDCILEEKSSLTERISSKTNNKDSKTHTVKI